MSAVTTPPAPRVPAGPRSLAAAASRRGVLGAIAATSLMALPAMPADAAETGADWRDLVATYRRSKAEWGPLHAVLEQREWEYAARRPAAPARPALARPVLQDTTIAEIKTIPLDKEASVYGAELAEWERRCEPLRQEIVGAAESEAKAAWDRYTGALEAIEAYPSPTLPLLVEKIDILAAEYGCDDDHVGAVFSDIHRLAGRA